MSGRAVKAEAKSGVASMNTVEVLRSAQRATCARMVDLFSDGWDGPRLGVVVRGAGDGEDNAVDVNVALRGHDDACILEMCRGLHTGTTIEGVPLYDALDEKRRTLALAESPVTWGEMRVIAEWPPRG